jgi:integrase
VLAQEEARELLDAIDTSTLVGLRDRALIATMIYTLGRVAAVIKMRVEDYYTQGHRGWVRLHEKVSKRHEMHSRCGPRGLALWGGAKRPSASSAFRPPLLTRCGHS